jgi:hypothetical protein
MVVLSFVNINWYKKYFLRKLESQEARTKLANICIDTYLALIDKRFNWRCVGRYALEP